MLPDAHRGAAHPAGRGGLPEPGDPAGADPGASGAGVDGHIGRGGPGEQPDDQHDGTTADGGRFHGRAPVGDRAGGAGARPTAEREDAGGGGNRARCRQGVEPRRGRVGACGDPRRRALRPGRQQPRHAV